MKISEDIIIAEVNSDTTTRCKSSKTTDRGMQALKVRTHLKAGSTSAVDCSNLICSDDATPQRTNLGQSCECVSKA